MRKLLILLTCIMPCSDAPGTERSVLLRRELEYLLDLPEPPTAIYVCCILEVLDVVADVAARGGLAVGKDLSVICRTPCRMQDRAPFSAWVYGPELVGTQLVDTAKKLADDPHRVFHVDVPMQFVDKE